MNKLFALLVALLVASAATAQSQHGKQSDIPKLTPVCVGNTVQASNNMGDWVVLIQDYDGKTVMMRCNNSTFLYNPQDLKPTNAPQEIQGKTWMSGSDLTWFLYAPKR